MRYLCLVYPDEEFGPSPAQVREFVAFRDAATRAGVYLDAGRLRPPETATTVRMSGDGIVLTDGPFAEIREQVGGYVVLDCADLDEVLQWVPRLPGIRDGAVEVRPLVEFGR